MTLRDIGWKNIYAYCDYGSAEKWYQDIKEKVSVNLLAAVRNLQKFNIRSQAVPHTNDGPVKIAVGDNFKKVVTDSGRDAFIEFYSPRCQHCQRFEPTWDQLGRKMTNESVDIIKIDATANDWPDSKYIIYGYPTIYWKFADSSKSPIQYDDARSLNRLIKFVAMHASTELKGWDRQGKPKRIKV